MINEYDHVMIKATGIAGIVVSKIEKNGEHLYTVESDEKGVPGGAGEPDDWKLFICVEDELEKDGS